GTYRTTGFVGCAYCYEAFLPLIDEDIRQLQHNNAAHVGRSPVGSQEADTYARLETAMERAVAARDFGEAARLQELMRRLREGR
ncbi:MAG: UvrB/UvrC motif-containing protein, partial [Clostridiales bacterium]|nr:UvrB/UvrC motif-containing protein [Clostridiales bacterium]